MARKHGFQKGNPGGPGNGRWRKVMLLKQAIVDCTEPEDVKEIFQKVIKLAKAGDLDAAKLFFDRVLGKPVELEEGEDKAKIEVTFDISALKQAHDNFARRQLGVRSDLKALGDDRENSGEKPVDSQEA